jgi:hypothetical protein
MVGAHRIELCTSGNRPDARPSSYAPKMAESGRLELPCPNWDVPVFEAGAVAAVPTLQTGGW